MPRMLRIIGQDGLSAPFFQMDIAASALGVGGLQTLLERLASRHLSDDEIVAASLRRNMPGYATHLVIIPPDMRAFERGEYVEWRIEPNVWYSAHFVDVAPKPRKARQPKRKSPAR